MVSWAESSSIVCSVLPSMIEIYGVAELACCLVLLYLGSTVYSAMEIACVSSLGGPPGSKNVISNLTLHVGLRMQCNYRDSLRLRNASYAMHYLCLHHNYQASLCFTVFSNNLYWIFKTSIKQQWLVIYWTNLWWPVGQSLFIYVGLISSAHTIRIKGWQA